MDTLYHLGIAIGLGLLVGLQREWAEKRFAGVRTFPLITVLGSICALLSEDFGGWVLAAGLLTVASFFVVGDLRKEKSLDGITTEVAALVMYGVGALLIREDLWIGVSLGAATAVLLHAKGPLHRFIDAIDARDLRGVMQLALVGLVVLPAMPDHDMGPYDVVNPRHAWLMVSLIVGISLAGYVAQRLLGPKAGSVLAGLLGGVVSSTATTVSEARRTGSQEGLNGVATVVVVLASCVSFFRLLVEVAVAAPDILGEVWQPLTAMAGFMFLVGLLTALLGQRGAGHSEPETQAPTDLRGAVFFGVLYVVVLVAVEAVRDYLGDEALYTLAAASGLTDVDAITLSTANLASEGRLAPDKTWRVILIAGLSNMAFKYGVVCSLGTWGLVARTAAPFGATLLGGSAILYFWP